jgi:hypothetical protein
MADNGDFDRRLGSERSQEGVGVVEVDADPGHVAHDASHDPYGRRGVECQEDVRRGRLGGVQVALGAGLRDVAPRGGDGGGDGRARDREGESAATGWCFTSTRCSTIVSTARAMPMPAARLAERAFR